MRPIEVGLALLTVTSVIGALAYAPAVNHWAWEHPHYPIAAGTLAGWAFIIYREVKRDG